jgi:hypothetical protein
MTCRYDKTDWRDVLYTSVRNTPGGVSDAAVFLTTRRGRSMHPETLRAKLRGVEGESITVEIADMLTEWMQEKKQPDASAWIQAFASAHGLVAIPIESPMQAPDATDLSAILEKSLNLDVEGGRLSQLLLEALRDRSISINEADQIAGQIDQEMRLLARMRRNVIRVAETGGQLVINQNPEV